MNNLFKIIILGDSSVGKTNIVTRYTKNEFENDMISTIGVDLFTKRIEKNNNEYNIQIWDTAGQERFRAIVKSVFNSVKGIILVYDITNRTSFEHVLYWLNNVRENSDENLPICLVGNKNDLEHNRIISYKEGENLAKENNISFFEVSALNNIKIDDAFNDLIQKIIENGSTKKYISKPNAININSKNNSKNNNNNANNVNNEKSSEKGCFCQ